MMCDLRYLMRAKKDFLSAYRVYTKFQNDERDVNLVVYLLQQSVEKLLKASLEFEGIRPPYTHEITNLIKLVKNSDSKLCITEWIDDNSEMLSSWEVNSRYNLDFTVEIRKVERALDEVKKLFNCNGFSINKSEELLEELQIRDNLESLMNTIPEKDYTREELNLLWMFLGRKSIVNNTHLFDSNN